MVEQELNRDIITTDILEFINKRQIMSSKTLIILDIFLKNIIFAL